MSISKTSYQRNKMNKKTDDIFKISLTHARTNKQNTIVTMAAIGRNT